MLLWFRLAKTRRTMKSSLMTMKYSKSLFRLIAAPSLLFLGDAGESHAQSFRDAVIQKQDTRERLMSERREYIMAPLRNAAQCYEIDKPSRSDIYPLICKKKDEGFFAITKSLPRGFYQGDSFRGNLYGDNGYYFIEPNSKFITYVTIQQKSNDLILVSGSHSFCDEHDSLECYIKEGKCYSREGYVSRFKPKTIRSIVENFDYR